ncbi:NETI motif-containing protein [Alkalibacillus silvisoli]|uniref:NETI motif-containing protein n=1 Tax=Alkalibacillus silvisoli TaxID=392823 RepID=A0ABN0ZVC9_9BACI
MKKKNYRVSDYPSIDACLDQMKEEGFTPVKRIEKPVFLEQDKGQEPEPFRQEIVFEAVKMD